MGNETLPGGMPEHEGEKYLRMIGLGHLAGQTIVRKDGTSMVVRDFLEDERCAQFARPAFIGLENMDPNDPDYQATVAGIRAGLSAWAGINPDTEA